MSAFPRFNLGTLHGGESVRTQEELAQSKELMPGLAREAVLDFSRESDWLRYHNPKDLAISISLEASELLEHFQWLTNEEVERSIKDAARATRKAHAGLNLSLSPTTTFGSNSGWAR